MIFAKLDVTLPRHHRVLRIPRGARRAAAIGVYGVAMMYTREAELDGWVPLDALADVATASSLTDLEAVGLIAREQREGADGVAVLRYAAKNETKVQIEERRRLEREKKRRQRGTGKGSDEITFPAAVPPSVPPGQHEVSRGDSRGSPGSDSGSDLSSLPEGMQGEAPPAPATPLAGGPLDLTAATFDIAPLGEGVSRETAQPCALSTSPAELKNYAQGFGLLGLRGQRGAERQDALRAAGEAWSRWCDGNRKPRNGFKFLEWANGGAPGFTRRTGITLAKAPLPPPPLKRTMTGQETAEAAERLANLVAGLGG